MSIDFTPARRSNGSAGPTDYDLCIYRVDRKSRSGRPTSLYLKVSPEAIAKWGIRDGDQVTGHFMDGIWETRLCRDGQAGFTIRISNKENKVRLCPVNWGMFRLSCTKQQADKTGVTKQKFFTLMETKGGSAFFMEKEGINFLPARLNGKAG